MLSLLKHILVYFLFSFLLIPRFWRFHCVCVQVWFLWSRRVARKQRRAVRMISCRTCLLAGVWTSSVGKELTSTMGPGQTARGEYRWTKQNQQYEIWTNRFLEYKLTVGGISFKDIVVHTGPPQDFVTVIPQTYYCTHRISLGELPRHINAGSVIHSCIFTVMWYELENWSITPFHVLLSSPRLPSKSVISCTPRSWRLSVEAIAKY